MTPPPTSADVIRRLRARPGRGGVRLTYAEAALALRLIETGGRALVEARRLQLELAEARA